MPLSHCKARCSIKSQLRFQIREGHKCSQGSTRQPPLDVAQGYFVCRLSVVFAPLVCTATRNIQTKVFVLAIFWVPGTLEQICSLKTQHRFFYDYHTFSIHSISGKVKCFNIN